MLQEEELRGAPVLVLANKQDLPNAMNELEVRIFDIRAMPKVHVIRNDRFLSPFSHVYFWRVDIFQRQLFLSIAK